MTRCSLLIVTLFLALGPVAAALDLEEILDQARTDVVRGNLEAARLTLEPLGEPSADIALGHLLREAARSAEAVKAFRAALKTDSDNVEARTGLGEALLDLGKTGEAIPFLEQAAAQGSALALCALGRARLDLGETAMALAAWRQGAEAGDGPDNRNAAELYEYYRERLRSEFKEMRQKGWNAHRRGQYETAGRLLLGYALARGDAREEALAGARSALAAGLPADLALEGFHLVLGSEPDRDDRAAALAGSGAARLQLDDAAGAAEDFAAALELLPDDTEALFGSAVALARLGRDEEALRQLIAAFDRASPEILWSLREFAREESSFTGPGADPRFRALIWGS